MMVPQVDLANHSFDSNAEWAANFTKGTLSLTATQDVAEGEPICIDYGTDLDNTQLMRMFGFVVPGNPNDRLDFSAAQLPKNTPDVSFDALYANRERQQHHYLLADPCLKSVGLYDVVKEYDHSSKAHNGKGIVSCHKNPMLSRKLSAVLSLPVYESEQHAEKAISHTAGCLPCQGVYVVLCRDCSQPVTSRL